MISNMISSDGKYAEPGLLSVSLSLSLVPRQTYPFARGKKNAVRLTEQRPDEHSVSRNSISVTTTGNTRLKLFSCIKTRLR